MPANGASRPIPRTSVRTIPPNGKAESWTIWPGGKSAGQMSSHCTTNNERAATATAKSRGPNPSVMANQ